MFPSNTTDLFALFTMEELTDHAFSLVELPIVSYAIAPFLVLLLVCFLFGRLVFANEANSAAQATSVTPLPQATWVTPVPEASFCNLFREDLACQQPDTNVVATYRLSNDKFMTIIVGPSCDFRDGQGSIVLCREQFSDSDSGTSIYGNVQFAKKQAGAKLVPLVFTANAPDFRNVSDGHGMLAKRDELQSVYVDACHMASREGAKAIAFPLISANDRKGDAGAKNIIRMGVEAIVQFAAREDALQNTVKDIILCASTWKEAKKVLSVSDDMLEGYLKACVTCGRKKRVQ